MREIDYEMSNVIMALDFKMSLSLRHGTKGSEAKGQVWNLI